MQKPTAEERMLPAQRDEVKQVGAKEYHRANRAIVEGFIEDGILTGRAQAITVTRVEQRFRELQQWLLIKQRQPWKRVGQSWEEWAEPNLGYSYKTIDEAIRDHEKLGDPLMQLLVELDVKKQQIRMLRRALEAGTVRIEGTAIIDGRLRLDVASDADRVKAYIDTLKAEKAVLAEELDGARQQQVKKDAASEKREAKLHELLEAKDQTIAHYTMTPESTALGTEADARFWPHLKDWQKEMELRFLQVDALLGAEGHSAGFWYELGTLIGWMQEELYQRGMALLRSRGGAFMEFARLERRPEVQVPPGRWPERTGTALAERVLAEAEARGLTNGHGGAHSLPVGSVDTPETASIELD